MNIQSTALVSSLLVLAFSTPSLANKVVDDNFAVDGTAQTDASYFGSSNSNAIEINANSIGLVTGPSGRQMHGLFETQTLANAGDSLKATISFRTPVSVASTDEDIRIGLFDHLERNTADQLGQNTKYSKASPNALYAGLPGFYFVENSDSASDIDIRRSEPSKTGRLLSTTQGFKAFGSGPDLGYAITPNTDYTVVFTVTRTEKGALEIRADFADGTRTSVDKKPASYSFGMLAVGASTSAVGSSNKVGKDSAAVNDNGIDLTAFSVEFIAAK